MIRVKKNDKESAERFFQRFNGFVQKSRIILKTKVRQYWEKKPNKRRVRQAAIMREHYRRKREKEQYY